MSRSRSSRSLRIAAGPLLALLVTLWASGSTIETFGPPAPVPPNVLLIVADDMGWGDLRLHGNERIDTPVLDRFAQESARFDRFFVSPVCAPTRASLLTGRYHLRTGVSSVTGGLETMRASEVTLAEALRGRGYATSLTGKWHLGAHYPHTPQPQGFDRFVGFFEGHTNNYFDATLIDNGRSRPTRGYITDVFTDRAIQFVREHRERPFFAYVAYNAPHAPYQVPDRYFDKYTARGLDPVAASIYGMVENLDANVGRLLKTLDDLSLTGRTIVVFLTDNGPQTDRPNGGMKGRKGSVDEGGVRVPLFVRWPGHTQPGAVVRRNAAHIDIMPTLLEVTATPAPRNIALDGRSLVPLLEGRDTEWPDRRLFMHQRRDRTRVDSTPGSVRTDRWRLVRTPAAAALYDMTADPGQRHDVASTHADVAGELRDAYDAWFADVTREGLDRPRIPVGYRQAPVVDLPATEAVLGGSVAFQGKQGWAHDWITNWSRETDRISWNVEAVRRGRYEATVQYACAPADVGGTVVLEIDGQARLTTKVARAHDAPIVARPDRQPRTEVSERIWATLPLGTIVLERGPHTLSLRADRIAGRQVMDLKSVTLRARD